MKTHASVKEFAEPVNNLVADAKELMAVTANLAEERVAGARRRLAAAMERGRGALQAVQRKAASGAKAADRTIRAHPYRTMGIALGVGLLVGVLARRRASLGPK
jgi:ElaB/YqjD/DUF883 family membrane-anchored ribosome-binding protein